MTGIFNARILASIAMLVFVGAAIASSTGAFFSDTETSTGNTFTAGDIDLQIDNTSYAVDCNIAELATCTGNLVFSADTSWEQQDLIAGQQHFFDFTDLKPGDQGADAISIHVGSNSAWMCAAARLTEDSDNGFTEPEDEVSGTNTDDDDGTSDGDLDAGLNFAFWVDDGDSVFETNETTFLTGPLSNITLAGNKLTLADTNGSILGGTDPIPGDETFYIGKVWCYGTLSEDAQDPNVDGTPETRGTGWTCDGSTAGNIGQTDTAVGDMQFYAVQSRNNSAFTCSEGYTPIWQQS